MCVCRGLCRCRVGWGGCESSCSIMYYYYGYRHIAQVVDSLEILLLRSTGTTLECHIGRHGCTDPLAVAAAAAAAAAAEGDLRQLTSLRQYQRRLLLLLLPCQCFADCRYCYRCCLHSSYYDYLQGESIVINRNYTESMRLPVSKCIVNLQSN